MKIKIVKWQGRIDPIYKELVEVEAKMLQVGWNEEEECLCIELEDILEALNLR